MGLLHHRRLDPLLLNSPLRRPPVAAAVALVLALLVLVAAVTLLGLLGSLRSEVARVFVIATALSTLLAIVPLAILSYLDRRERESRWLFAVAFLWGAFVSTGLALPVNSAILLVIMEWVEQNPVVLELLGPDAAIMLGAPIAGPLVEEAVKGLGLLALFFFLRAEFDGVRDGLVYGGLIGLGFTWFEAPLYIGQGYAEHGVAPWGLQLGWRYALFGLSGHVMFTGLFGAALGLALQTRRRWLKAIAPIVGLGLAIVAHALNNVLPLLFALRGAAAGEPPPGNEPPPSVPFWEAWIGGSVADLTIFLPFLALMGGLLWRSGVWERRVIREELASEVGRAVTAEEYQQIARDRMFRTRRIDRIHPAQSRALVNAQHELAFRKRRVRDAGGDPEQDPLVRAWRDEILLLRGPAGG
jgi:RsiW-degrading membrane proteinase PrsW (M82 family)